MTRESELSAFNACKSDKLKYLKSNTVPLSPQIRNAFLCVDFFQGAELYQENEETLLEISLKR
jgi:hypothetical protein